MEQNQFKDELFKALLNMDTFKKDKEAEETKPIYYDYESLSPEELDVRLAELRTAFKVMSFKTEKPDMNDYYAYIMMKRDQLDVRIRALEHIVPFVDLNDKDK